MADWAVPLSDREIAIGIMFILLLALCIFSAKFFRRYRGEGKNKFDLGFGFFFVFILLGQLIFFLYYYYITEFEQSSENLIFWKVATLLQLCGFGILFVISEKKILDGKDYYLFFIGFCVMAGVALFQPTVHSATTWAMLSLAFALFIPISYVYLAIKSEGVYRKRSLFVFFGFIIYFIGIEIVSLNLANIIMAATGGLITIYHLSIIGYLLRIVALLLFSEGFIESN